MYKDMQKLTQLLTLTTVILFSYSLELDAQQMGVEFDTELQFTPDGYTNYLNRLRLSADYAINEHLTLSAASISIAKSREESLLDDLQGFSNIEAEPQPLALSLLGMNWNAGERHSLFLGIRTVNEDYFVSPVTSLFINSSCGIFPTLSCNMDIANYPVASMGMHYSYTAPSYCIQASAYNGQAYDRWTGIDNIWRITPHSDGLFFISQVDWQQGKGHYHVGAAQHTGVSGGESAQTALWTYTEHSLTDRLSLIVDYSHAIGHSRLCTDFVGLGAQYSWSQSAIGLFTDYARFRHEEEWATELTYKFDLNSLLFLQASCQLIHHGSWQSVGLIRMGIRI